MDVRITIETTFDNGEKRTHQLDSISRPYRVTCQRGSGCASKMGRGSSNKSRGQSFATRSRRSPERAASVLLAPRFAPSMTIARAFSTRSLGGFGSKPRAFAAVPAMRGQRRCPAGLFLRWRFSFQTGLPRNCNGSMPSLDLGIPFVNGGVKTGHWAGQKPATLGLGVTRATRRRPVSRASQIAGG